MTRSKIYFFRPKKPPTFLVPVLAVLAVSLTACSAKRQVVSPQLFPCPSGKGPGTMQQRLTLDHSSPSHTSHKILCVKHRVAHLLGHALHVLPALHQLLLVAGAVLVRVLHGPRESLVAVPI